MGFQGWFFTHSICRRPKKYLKNNFKYIKQTKTKYMMAKIMNEEALRRKLKIKGDIRKYFLDKPFTFNGPDGF